MHTLSFAMLNDLEFVNGPFHVNLEILNRETLLQAIQEITNPFLIRILRIKNLNHKDDEYYSIRKGEIMDETGYFQDGDFNIEDVVTDLINDNFYCWNHYQKYYVIAFAIDREIFHMSSKGFNKKKIQWA